ncbi:MAG: hypothetical protein ABWY04_02375 [Arthrobacter sp.]
MMTPGNALTTPEGTEAVGCTSYPGALFFDPLAAPSLPEAERYIPDERRSTIQTVVDEKALRAASLAKVSRELVRMLRERSR